MERTEYDHIRSDITLQRQNVDTEVRNVYRGIFVHLYYITLIEKHSEEVTSTEFPLLRNIKVVNYLTDPFSVTSYL